MGAVHKSTAGANAVTKGAKKEQNGDWSVGPVWLSQEFCGFKGSLRVTINREVKKFRNQNKHCTFFA